MGQRTGLAIGVSLIVGAILAAGAPAAGAATFHAERIAGNLHRGYAELDGAPPGAPIDIVAALDDMVAWNGGRPLRCLA